MKTKKIKKEIKEFFKFFKGWFKEVAHLLILFIAIYLAYFGILNIFFIITNKIKPFSFVGFMWALLKTIATFIIICGYFLFLERTKHEEIIEIINQIQQSNEDIEQGKERSIDKFIEELKKESEEK